MKEALAAEHATVWSPGFDPYMQRKAAATAAQVSAFEARFHAFVVEVVQLVKQAR